LEEISSVTFIKCAQTFTLVNAPVLNYSITYVRCEAFKAMMIPIAVFWLVTSSSAVVGYQHFRGPCCLNLQGVRIAY
jgi:hypothetical protein